MVVERCDVAIVGGGPAGSSLAWGLRGVGLSTVLLDKQSFPRDKTCAGWVTPQVFKALAIDPARYAKNGRTLQPIHGFRVSRMGGRARRWRSPAPLSYGIRRCEFDHFLLRRSEADLRLGEPLHTLERSDAGWRVNGTLEARLLVGAGGHFCPVARKLTDRGAKELVIAAQEMEFAVAAGEEDALDVEQDLPELTFSRDLDGYGWVFRKGRYLNVGLGRRSRSGRLGPHVARFFERLRAQGKLPSTTPDAVHGHAYLLYGESGRPLRGEAVALVGDAAGLAYPTSGEGIRPAVESGLLLARALRREADWGVALAAYAGSVEARFGKRQPGQRPPARLLAPLAGPLLAWPWFARRVVVERWFLHASQPVLESPARVGEVF